MQLEQSQFEVDTYGFTLLPAVLNHDEICRLRQLGARLEHDHGEDHLHAGTARHVSNLVARDPAYFPLIDHPLVYPLVESLLGEQLILASLNSRIVRPGDGDQGLHGDVPAGLRRSGPPIMVNTVWMLDDWSVETGATRVVPGSHRMPHDCPPLGRQLPLVVPALAPAGSVLVFDGRCWHGGGCNSSTTDRHGIFGHYRVSDWTTFQCDPHQEFETSWLSQLSLRQRRLLRMEHGVLGRRWLQDGA